MLVFLSLVAVSVLSAYLYVKYMYSYWQRKNVKYLKPTFPFGNLWNTVLGKMSIYEELVEQYNSTDEPVLGFYMTWQPGLLIRDPEIAYNVLVKDVATFNHRGLHTDHEVDPLTYGLLFLSGEKWRNLRTSLTPAFTPGKLKAMFSIFVESGHLLQKHVAQLADTQKVANICELSAHHAINSIVPAGFGIDVDCFQNPEAEFYKYSKKAFELTLSNRLRQVALLLFPNLLKFFRIRVFHKSVHDFLLSVVKKNIEFREKNNVTRKDFFQLLMQLRNFGTISQSDEDWRTRTDKKLKSLTLNEIVAQAFTFLAGGYETSSTTMSFCLYELARATEIQRKCQAEIDSVLSKYNGQFTDDAMTEMKYLECCIDETLRRRPPVGAVSRLCTQDYKLPNCDLVIEKGVLIMIPMLALHHDPKYWEDPYTFNPDHFSEENQRSKSFVERPHFPFSIGPRNCIGMRLGKMQTKVSLAVILQKFNFGLAEEHIGQEVKYSPKSPFLIPADEIRLKVSHR